VLTTFTVAGAGVDELVITYIVACMFVKFTFIGEDADTLPLTDTLMLVGGGSIVVVGGIVVVAIVVGTVVVVDVVVTVVVTLVVGIELGPGGALITNTVL